MGHVIFKKGWEIPEREATPEAVFVNRRRFLKAAGLGAAGLILGCGHDRSFTPFQSDILGQGGLGEEGLRASADLYPVTQNERFQLDRPLTPASIAGRFNNFYEFSVGKEDILENATRFKTVPWRIKISGLVEKPETVDVDDLIRKMPLEERLYRHRCVEAWAMAVPWTGFPMKALLDRVAPLSSARYVRMTTFLNPQVAPEQFGNPEWPWPYVEALTLEEAANELTMLVTGIYGQPLPIQHGAPIRLIVPWKYGFKSVKSIVSIEFVAQPPATFWNTLVPQEYGFTANVNPNISHPRWSQQTELMIGTQERRPTLLYNGYGDFVAHLYA